MDSQDFDEKAVNAFELGLISFDQIDRYRDHLFEEYKKGLFRDNDPMDRIGSADIRD